MNLPPTPLVAILIVLLVAAWIFFKLPRPHLYFVLDIGWFTSTSIMYHNHAKRTTEYVGLHLFIGSKKILGCCLYNLN